MSLTSAIDPFAEMADRHFTLDSGWTYATYRDESDDNRKYWHYLICDEAQIELNGPSYRLYSRAEIESLMGEK